MRELEFRSHWGPGIDPKIRSAQMHRFFREAMRFIEQMDKQEWVLALMAVVVVGVICMRGFGSRSNY